MPLIRAYKHTYTHTNKHVYILQTRAAATRHSTTRFATYRPWHTLIPYLHTNTHTHIHTHIHTNMCTCNRPAQLRHDTTIPPGKEGRPTTRFVVDVDATGKLDMLEAWNPSTEVDVAGKRVLQTQALERALNNSKRKEMRLTMSRVGVMQTYKGVYVCVYVYM